MILDGPLKEMSPSALGCAGYAHFSYRVNLQVVIREIFLDKVPWVLPQTE
jgi:hypothetical protein